MSKDTETNSPAALLKRLADWRKLAMSFDAQRMMALAHLKTLISSPEHAEKAKEFLGEPLPSPVDEVFTRSELLDVMDEIEAPDELVEKMLAALGRLRRVAAAEWRESDHSFVDDGPYPGMSKRFEQMHGNGTWVDPEWREEASMWASAWKQAHLEGITPKEISYPADTFRKLLLGNSPYAFYLFQWVPYQEFHKRRLKMLHDAKTFDGREAFGVWPNGDSFGPFKDNEVEFIRISRKQLTFEWKDPILQMPRV